MFVKQLSEYKIFEFQWEKKFASVFPLEFNFTIRPKTKDHSGVYFVFGIYKLFWFETAIYDSRHAKER
jgi:hypothetical protein